MPDQRVIVVGAGVGGLAAALELAAQGQEVWVFDAADSPGGKLRQLRMGGALLDAGPTVFTMRWVFDELFARIGEVLDQHLTMRRIRTLARHAWGPDQRLDLFADIQASAEAIGDFAGAREAAGYRAFCARARQIYNTLEQPFLRGARPNPLSLSWRVGQRGLVGFTRISPFGSMWQALGKYFRDPRLHQLFGRYATYCGSSPFLSPATLMLVAHVEQEGVWLLDDGMHALAVTLEQLARQRGATFRYGAPVRNIITRGGRASGVELVNGEQFDAKAVIFNGDAAALASGLLGPGVAPAVRRHDPTQRTLSARTWHLVTRTQGFPLLRHNVFFSGDYGGEFAQLHQRSLPADPTVYVCAQDRGDGDDAPPRDMERLMILANAPATGDAGDMAPAELARHAAATQRRMATSGLRVQDDLDTAMHTGPQDFGRMFPATGGALYGPASHGWMASFRRPGARTRLAGLYLAGGSTHPGPGVPMAVLSGGHAVASVLQDISARHPARTV
ncbi:MAG: CrtD protein [Betaproteobacteria bacterium HGW-Betaproteobacteria-3]|jgi:1-hydroxycarotenoid 3,4-desaturase|nr:MAG: CrtD protein [Betaproteobacteria bacterium HGW-Betaproteobacteria-3]